MLYVVCEGEEGKSCYTFIDRVLQEYNRGRDYQLIAVGGNLGLSSVILDLSLNRGDTLLLFIDCVSEIGGVAIFDLFIMWSEYCESCGAAFKYVDFYCFEEFYLGYTDLASLANVADAYRISLLNIQRYIALGEDYYRVREFVSVWESLVGHSRTREQFASSLVSVLLKRAVGDFRLTKKLIGCCWINSCVDVQSSRKISVSKCSRCIYRAKGRDFHGKLMDLEDGRLSDESESLSHIFD